MVSFEKRYENNQLYGVTGNFKCSENTANEIFK